MKRIMIVLTLMANLAIAETMVTPSLSPRVLKQIQALRAEKTRRTPVERKMDSQLSYLSREARGLHKVQDAPVLRSRVKRQWDGRVIVDISAVPSVALNQAITKAGGNVIYESPRWKSIRASLPPTSLAGIAARSDVKRITRGQKPTVHTGPITNEADLANNAAFARAEYDVDGSGVKVGIISDSVDHYRDSIDNGELPESFTVLPDRSGIEEGSTGEGTAMSEIVHDIAPGASLYFASASGGKAFFADSILLLRECGCDIIVDDISYSNEWQFQDDEIGQAINEVVADGAVYFSSSGNEGSLKAGNSTTWEGNFVDGGTHELLPDGQIHSFGPQNYNSLLSDDSGVTLQWSDEYNSSSNDYDLYILDANGVDVVAFSTDTQDGNDWPFESVDEVHPGEQIIIWKAHEAAPRYVRISCTGSPIEIATAGQTIGHAGTANCICVASADASIVAPDAFTVDDVLDDASSDGPHKMFYYPDGNAITPGNFLASGGVTVQTPSITAGDGGATSVPGFEAFYGTSAAAPAAAAMAALVWSWEPNMVNTQVRTILETSCLDIEDPGFDINSGQGILMADLALSNAFSPSGSPPQAIDDALQTAKNQILILLTETLAANDTDPDDDVLTVIGIPRTRSGTVTLVDGTLTYTPAKDYIGLDMFTYTISDGYGYTATGTVTVTVTDEALDEEVTTDLVI